jgi:mannitol-1-/sugar-/sorbitol-6-phosphatase
VVRSSPALDVSVRDGSRQRVFGVDAILFDMDGTLVDSTYCVERTWRLWAGKHGLDFDALMAIAHGRQNHETIQQIAPHLDTPEEKAFLVQLEESCHEGIVPVRGARALLDTLPPDRWAVVTSAWRRLAEIRLGCANLPIPPVLVTADDIRRSKPHPDGYLAAAARLGVEPSACLVLEDAHAGIEAAHAAGMTVVGVTTTFPREQLGCEWCLDDFGAMTVRLLRPSSSLSGTDTSRADPPLPSADRLP